MKRVEIRASKTKITTVSSIRVIPEANGPDRRGGGEVIFMRVNRFVSEPQEYEKPLRIQCFS